MKWLQSYDLQRDRRLVHRYRTTDIEIDSNVCKIRTSSTKEKTYICTQLHRLCSHQNTRTEDPREKISYV